MKHTARIQPDRAKCYGLCLLSIYTRSNKNLNTAPKNNPHLKIDTRIHTKNRLKITHIGLKINALESLYIESQLKITSILLKIDEGRRRSIHLKITRIGLKIDDIGLKIG